MKTEVPDPEAKVHQDAIGGMDVKQPTHVIEFQGVSFETSLPMGINPFQKTGNSFDATTPNYEDINKLPVGDYWVRRMVAGKDSSGQPTPAGEEREIEILQGDKGPVITLESACEPSFTLRAGTENLMRSLGYTVEESYGAQRITGIPTPDTVKGAAGLLGVDIEFFAGGWVVPGDAYLRAYAEGKYPVSYENYRHDTEDDHLTAMVLGGEPLKEALKVAAEAALGKDQQTIDDAARFTDEFTATLRSVIPVDGPLFVFGDRYERSEGRQVLIKAGEKLGLDRETVENVLAHTQQAAKSFGIELQELK